VIRSRLTLAALAVLAPALAVVPARGAAPTRARPAPPAAASPAASPPVAPAAEPARATPGFTGRWLLDIAASDLGKIRRPPLSRTDEILEQGPWIDVHSLSIRAEGDTARLDYRYRTDGEAVNTVRGQEVRTRGSREGRALRFESVAKLLMIEVRVIERWTLAAGGDSLRMSRESRSPLGNETQRLVFVRGH